MSVIKESRFKKAMHNKNMVLPNIITILGLLSGVYSIMISVGSAAGNARIDQFVLASYFLILAAVFDGLDGKVARMVKGSSDFGVQLDSLCDLVSFGVAPAILVYEWLLRDFERLGLMAIFLFIASGALRLARFNVQSGIVSSKYFVGLPIPAAAAFIASSVIFIEAIGADKEKAFLQIFFLVSIYVLAFLMVSTIPFFSFKKIDYFKQRQFLSLVLIVIIISILVIKFEIVFFLMVFSYIVIGLLIAFFRLFKRKKKVDIQKEIVTENND